MLRVLKNDAAKADIDGGRPRAQELVEVVGGLVVRGVTEEETADICMGSVAHVKDLCNSSHLCGGPSPAAWARVPATNSK